MVGGVKYFPVDKMEGLENNPEMCAIADAVVARGVGDRGKRILEGIWRLARVTVTDPAN